MESIIIGLLIAVLAAVAVLIFCVARGGRDRRTETELLRMKSELTAGQESLRRELTEGTQNSIRTLGEILTNNQRATDEFQSRKFGDIDRSLSDKQDALRRTVTAQLSQMEERFKTFETANEQKLDNIRGTIEKRLSYIQEDNNKKLDAMRQTVDEKLQKTLEEKMTQSFQLVNERLEQVYKGLGEMQTLASGVGDLKKVLANVKTRGILGEIQLGAILEEILSPEQYETNVVTRKNSAKPVEYAVRLPGSDGGTVYLPIDSKFPADAYEKLRDAYDAGIPEQIAAEKKHLESVIKLFAKDIRDKYLDPPVTTEFGIMFLPFEGLYAEVVNLGLVEVLAREYKVSIAGPTTMAALLNSLQMGFRTLAIQKRSSEVWKVLGAVRTEFDRFGDVLEATQKRLEQTSSELDKLVGVRTRQIRSKLRTVTSLPQDEAAMLLNGESTDEQD